jgi:hypothetical protein
MIRIQGWTSRLETSGAPVTPPFGFAMPWVFASPENRLCECPLLIPEPKVLIQIFVRSQTVSALEFKLLGMLPFRLDGFRLGLGVGFRMTDP